MMIESLARIPPGMKVVNLEIWDNQIPPRGNPQEAEEELDGEGGGLSLSGIAGASDGEKGLFDQAVALVSREGKASTSFIQRHLAIGYNRAAKLLEQMEKEGVVGPANHVGKREVLARRTGGDEE